MTAWLLLLVVFGALWLLWLWLGALFDWITDHQHHYREQAVADRSGEDLSANREKVSSALQQPYSSSQQQQRS